MHKDLRPLYQALTRAALLAFVLFVVFATYIILREPTPPTAADAALVLAGVLFLLLGIVLLSTFSVAERSVSEAHAVADECSARVDPWQMQSALMSASDQRMPYTPLLHNGVILYAALQLEELAEELVVLSSALRTGAHPASSQALLGEDFGDIALSMSAASKAVRQKIASLEVHQPLSVEHAMGLLDGTTDLAVVNCGFALSAGLPGAAGYLEVGNSNHSKVNPATGKIDKTPDGKWIKGSAYFAPKLENVLRDHSPVWALKHGLITADDLLQTR
jgi:hypothetical protein